MSKHLLSGVYHIPLQGKSPGINGANWHKRYTELDAKVRNGWDGNYGVALGVNGVYDIDVDIAKYYPHKHHLKKLYHYAERVFPKTGAYWGRCAGEWGHFLYRDPNLSAEEDVKIRRYYPEPNQKVCPALVELRVQGQSLFWGTHPDTNQPLAHGELGPPAEVPYDEVLRQVGWFGCLLHLASVWERGSRHEIAYPAAGVLYKAGWSQKRAEELIRAVCDVVCDEEWRSRVNDVYTTFKRGGGGEDIVGYTALAGLVDQAFADEFSYAALIGSDGEPRMVAVQSETHDTPKVLFRPLGEILAERGDTVLESVPLLGKDGILLRGVLTLIAAHPKGGKTTLLVHSAREWIRQGLRVAWLSEEPLAAWRQRWEMFPELAEIIMPDRPISDPKGWLEQVAQLQPDVLVVDTIRRFCRIDDENSSAQVHRAIRPLQELLTKVPRCAVLLVHHTGKRRSMTAEDASTLDVAGSHAFVGDVDTILTVLPNGEEKNQRVVKVIESRIYLDLPEEDRILIAELSEDRRDYRWVARYSEVHQHQEQNTQRARILRALESIDGGTASDVADILRNERYPLSVKQVRRLLERMVEDGLLTKSGSGSPKDPFVYLPLVKPEEMINPFTNDVPNVPNVPDVPNVPKDDHCTELVIRDMEPKTDVPNDLSRVHLLGTSCETLGNVPNVPNALLEPTVAEYQSFTGDPVRDRLLRFARGLNYPRVTAPISAVTKLHLASPQQWETVVKNATPTYLEKIVEGVAAMYPTQWEATR